MLWFNKKLVCLPLFGRQWRWASHCGTLRSTLAAESCQGSRTQRPDLEEQRAFTAPQTSQIRPVSAEQHFRSGILHDLEQASDTDMLSDLFLHLRVFSLTPTSLTSKQGSQGGTEATLLQMKSSCFPVSCLCLLTGTLYISLLFGSVSSIDTWESPSTFNLLDNIYLAWVDCQRH